MLLFLFIGIAAVSVLWEIYYKRVWLRGVDVKLWFDADTLYEGSRTRLYEVIENRKRLPLPVLEVGFHTKKELDFADTENTSVSDYIYKRDVFSVLGRQRITREIGVSCKKRGHYKVSDADITTHTLLYRKSYGVGIETDAAIYVYARMTDVSEIMTLCEHMLGTLQCAKRLYEDPFAFRTIRSYTTDDPMKAINWKASAKTGGLMVNTFDSVQSQKAMIFLDVSDTGILKQEALVEESIAIAATLARKLLKQGMETGFAFNGADGAYMLPSNKRSMLTVLERRLADFDAGAGTGSFAELISDERQEAGMLSDDTLMIYITKNPDEAFFDTLGKGARKHMALAVCPVLRGDEQTAKLCGSVNGGAFGSRVRVLVKEVAG
ncbi:MAG: DUF58 domain-containing protein [Lachnospiraceae bacterium]|nr:DUF58 domain-containing protein [Lachnospiraceae bacterium]